MRTQSQTSKKTLALKWQRLSKRVDVEVVDDILDEILHQLADLKSVSGTLADDKSGLCLRSQEELLAEVELPRAKTILRLMCARLSVRCSKWTGKEVSIYGDEVEFELPANKLPCKIKFANTMAEHWFEISDASAPEATPARARKTKRSTRAVV